MIRLTSLGLLATLLVVYGSTAGEDPVPKQPEPPVRLQKKARPQPDPAAEKKAPADPASEKKPGPDSAPEKKPEAPRQPEAKDAPDPEAQDLERELQQIAARVEKNMRTSEDRLAQKDPGDGTQQIQRDIVKDLAAFMELTKRQQQQQQQQRQIRQLGGSRGQSSAQNRASRQQRGQPSQDQPSPEQRADGNPGGGRGGREGMNKIADLYKDIWGHLPETLRQEMDQYAREQFMDKYSELLKQYYTTIAEKSRRKGD